MMSSNPSTSAAATPPGTTVQEFKIRVPKNGKKKHHVMRFNATLNVDFAQWSQVKMERENNLKEYRGMDDEQPKFGAGSEFGRDAREEARRKKFGIVARKYRSDDQPWILKVGGKNGKKFKGIREGGVSENAAYYVFTHAPDGAIEAYPLQEWYNFQPIQRYKALSAEEAEQEFGRRNKVMNFFSLMLRKRMRGDEAEGEVEDPDEKKTKTSKSKELKISDMDEWMDSDDDSSASDEEKDKEKEDSDANNKKKKAKKVAANKKKKKAVQDEAGEESDDGDEEGRERDYISDSSDSESDREGKANKELKSVAEEDALRKLLTSDEDSDDEEKEKSSGDEDGKKDANDKAKSDKAENSNKKDKADKDSSSEMSSDSDNDAPPKRTKGSQNSANNSRSATPTPNATGSSQSSAVQNAVASAGTSGQPSSKRPRFDPTPSSDYGVTEQAVRRYLARKPMTTTELLTKFKQRKSGVSSDRLVETMTQILKKINPVKQTIKGKMYLSIKP
ncbi:transcription factor IIFalpha [Arctopsyche grandis]|uniref:transcription factor IIFalpha n=1 Tax=Arctopsyche grandis TaxID=121162 RepID=UPI00406D792E